MGAQLAEHRNCGKCVPSFCRVCNELNQETNQTHNPWLYAPQSSTWSTQSYCNTLESDFPGRTSIRWFPLAAVDTISHSAHSTHIACSTSRGFLWNIWFLYRLWRGRSDSVLCLPRGWCFHYFDLMIYSLGGVRLLEDIAIGVYQEGFALRKACAFHPWKACNYRQCCCCCCHQVVSSHQSQLRIQGYSPTS